MLTAEIKWAVGMITAPRPIPTIGATLASLAAAGWPRTEVSIFSDDERSGCYRGWLVALRTLAFSSPRPTRILLVEDDVEFAAGLRGYLEHAIRSGAIDADSWYSLYRAGGLHEPFDGPAGDFPAVVAPRQCFGSLAYVLTPELARKFCDDPPFPAWRDGTDRAAGEFCRQHRIPYRVAWPSLVRHIGEVSSLDRSGGMEVNRQCREWARAIQGCDNGHFVFYTSSPLGADD
jgi:hypothetical protein